MNTGVQKISLSLKTLLYLDKICDKKVHFRNINVAFVPIRLSEFSAVVKPSVSCTVPE